MSEIRRSNIGLLEKIAGKRMNDILILINLFEIPTMCKRGAVILVTIHVTEQSSARYSSTARVSQGGDAATVKSRVARRSSRDLIRTQR